MEILTIKELTSSIKINLIADICQINPTLFNTGSTSEILDEIELASLGEIRMYIDNYYDFDVIKNSNDPMFKQFLKNIVIFRLYQRISSDMMTTNVLYNYEETVKILGQISLRKINPSTWSAKNNAYEPSSIFLWSSDQKINGQF